MMANNAKVNWGALADIPEISVNRFGSLDPSHVNWTTTKAFFLTHYDDEISEDVLSLQFLERLAESRNYSKLYLHELAFDYLKYWTTTDSIENGAQVNSLLDQLHLTGQIVFMNIDSPTRLYFQTPERELRIVDVTALSSGSNVGCVMYLFECSGKSEVVEKRILYTGSFRLTLKDLKEIRCLHNMNGSVKKIDKLYLDTTFCLEDAKEFPGRRQVTEQLCKVIRKAGERDPTVRFDISTPLRIQNLYFLQQLAAILNVSIHVPLELKRFLEGLSEFKGILYSDLRMKDRFHFDCGYSCDNKYCAGGLEWAVDFEVLTIDLGCNFSYHFDLNFVSPREDEKQWCQNKKTVYMTHGHSDFLRGIYSSRASRFEMGRLINYLQMNSLENVIPLQQSPQMRDYELRLLLEMACLDGKDEPAYLSEEPSSYYYDYTVSKYVEQVFVEFVRNVRTKNMYFEF